MVPVLLASAGVVLLALAVLAATAWNSPAWAAWSVVVDIFKMVGAAIYIHTTRPGKFKVWEGLLRDLGLSGDERVLDLGCGRGAVLMMSAKLLPRGTAVGIDL